MYYQIRQIINTKVGMVQDKNWSIQPCNTTQYSKIIVYTAEKFTYLEYITY